MMKIQLGFAICLLVITTVLILPASAQFTGCFRNSRCRNVVGGFSSARECCLSDAGMYYNDGSTCQQCIVYGWFDTELMAAEAVGAYSASVGYIKGTGGRLRLNIETIHDTTSDGDIIVSSQVLLPPGNIDIFFVVDNIAQEIQEEATLRLSLAGGNPPTGSFLRSDLRLVVDDSDSVVIELNQKDYIANERSDLSVTVRKLLPIANSVELIITPLTVQQYLAMPEDQRPALEEGQLAVLESDGLPFSPNRATANEDFSANTISIKFRADEKGRHVNDISSTIQLFDDNIDEADPELFVLVLSVMSAVNTAGIVLERPASIGMINDNDEIVFGFERSTYTFGEPPFEIEVDDVQIVKENNVITEQTYAVVVSALPNVPPNSGFTPATRGFSSGADFDVTGSLSIAGTLLTIAPDLQTQTFPITLFGDSTPEGTEAFQLTTSPVSVQDNLGPLYTRPGVSSTVFSSTYVIITDDDFIGIGWEQNYVVNENVGSFQACYRVTNPRVLDTDIVMLVDTVTGTADESDYRPISSFNFDQERTLPAGVANARACITVTIINDNVFENAESFSLQLVPLTTGPILSPEFATVTISLNDDGRCGELPGITNGAISYLTIGRNVYAAYSCDRFYSLVGSSVRTCQMSVGLFSGTAPRCTPICESPPALPNGRITFSPDTTGPQYDLNTVATYSCNRGYQLNTNSGNQRRTCVDGGTGNGGRFSGTAPTCEQLISVTFALSSYTFSESDGTGRVEVVTSRPASSAFDVRVTGGPSTQNSIANASSISQVKRFQEGSISLSFDFILNDDDFGLESVEVFVVTFSLVGSPLGIVVGGRAQTAVNVLDDDAVSVGIEETSYIVSESDGVVEITYELNRVALQDVTIHVVNIDVTAETDRDYDSSSYNLTIPAGSTSMTGRIVIVDDKILGERQESFVNTINSASPSAVTIAIRSALVFITDSDVSMRCPVGTYANNVSSGETTCVPCPGNSMSTMEGSRECTCLDGYYRTALEGANSPCMSRPSSCRNLQVVEERTRATTITVRWERPEITGRDDFYYNIFYSDDNETFIQHNSRPYMKQDALVDYSLSGLKSLTTYTIRVTAENGVSGQEGGDTRSCYIIGQTGGTRANAPSTVRGFCTNIVWTAPTRTYGRITGYDLNFVLSGTPNVTVTKRHNELFHVIGDEVTGNDQINTLVQVRAKTSSSEGKWSRLVSLGCNEQPTCSP